MNTDSRQVAMRPPVSADVARRLILAKAVSREKEIKQKHAKVLARFARFVISKLTTKTYISEQEACDVYNETLEKIVEVTAAARTVDHLDQMVHRLRINADLVTYENHPAGQYVFAAFADALEGCHQALTGEHTWN